MTPTTHETTRDLIDVEALFADPRFAVPSLSPDGNRLAYAAPHRGRVQGANDVRVVRAQSDTIVASLRERGVPVEYLVADDEGHGFANPENRMRLNRAVERHFAEHLGGRTARS
jgi:acetyl esterase/lipase